MSENDIGTSRIERHPVLEFKRQKEVTIYYHGQPIRAYEGETVASALYAAGVRTFSHSPSLNRPRGLFCAIGKCASCVMNIDGISNVRSCITPVRDGMTVEEQKGAGAFPETPEGDYGETVEDAEADIVVVGGGPAGLSAALEASSLGASVLLLDENHQLGGQLIKQTHRFFGSKEHDAGVRGVTIARRMIEKVESDERIRVMLQTTAFGYYPDGVIAAVRENRQLVRIKGRRVIFATGAAENSLAFENNDLPGVYGAGAAQTLMNVYGVKPGDEVLMVGSGNVGVIVSYQLIQAGVKIKAIVEAMPRIGAYFVHAAKVRRLGVPIYVGHSIKRAFGNGKVEGATIVKLDEKWRPVEGTEFDIKCDVICLSVGLHPSYELLAQAGCAIRFVPELSGHVAVHNRNLETTVPGIYVAGDSSGVEEASIAMMEGKVAAISAVFSLGTISGELKEEAEKRLEHTQAQLDSLREGPFGERGRKGKEKAFALYDEIMGVRR